MKSANNYILEILDVSLDRGEKTVLKNIDIKIQKDENWIILGPNGSGKSSLMNMVQAFLWPQKGDIKLMGKKFGEENIDVLRKKIGWVGQDIELKFNLSDTAESIIQSGAVGTIGIQFSNPTDTQKSKAAELIDILGLKKLIKKPFGQLSQGEKRITCIARALMTHPKLLILDEACAGLDPVARELFLQRLEKMGSLKNGPCIIFATHHVEEIRNLFTHIMMLKQGKILFQGPIEENLSSKNLAKVFGKKVSLSKHQGRYSLALV